ncbi:MAG: ORF6N domain-containing protein [Bacteroidota bacterium]
MAGLYQVETKVLNQQVKRNLKRFPDDFMFQLTQSEFENLKSQFVTSSWGGTRKLPFVFTEQGVAMLSGILNSDRAIAVNIQIMRIFTRVRQMLTDNTELRLDVEKIKRKPG